MVIFQYKKIPFGLVNALAAFTRILQQILQQCCNIIVYFNNILVFGSSKANHDQCLADLKSTLKRHNFIINEEKYLYSVENIKYLGRQLSSEGIKPLSNATQAIQQCPALSSKAELRSFLGMAGFFRGFINKFASLAHPLYRLLQDVLFYFGMEELAFEQLKRVLLQSPFLAFFDTNASICTILMTDALSVGLGATLSQVQDRKEKPVYFTSRKLHANHQYLYGRHFEIRTDHFTLKEVLTGGRKNSVAPAHISRWVARLLPNSFKVHYIKGCSNVVADCLSRLPSETCGNFFDFNINIATIHGDMLSCVTMMELSHATAEDPIL